MPPASFHILSESCRTAWGAPSRDFHGPHHAHATLPMPPYAYGAGAADSCPPPSTVVLEVQGYSHCQNGKICNALIYHKTRATRCLGHSSFACCLVIIVNSPLWCSSVLVWRTYFTGLLSTAALSKVICTMNIYTNSLLCSGFCLRCQECVTEPDRQVSNLMEFPFHSPATMPDIWLYSC